MQAYTSFQIFLTSSFIFEKTNIAVRLLQLDCLFDQIVLKLNHPQVVGILGKKDR